MLHHGGQKRCITAGRNVASRRAETLHHGGHKRCIPVLNCRITEKGGSLKGAKPPSEKFFGLCFLIFEKNISVLILPLLAIIFIWLNPPHFRRRHVSLVARVAGFVIPSRVLDRPARRLRRRVDAGSFTGSASGKRLDFIGSFPVENSPVKDAT